MDNVQKYSDQVADLQAVNAELERNSDEMIEKVMFMKEDWKREQEIVVSLGKDIKFKEE